MAHLITYYLELVTFVYLVVFYFRFRKITRTFRSLRNVSTEGIKEWPKVSIIVAARNEQESIEAGLTSLARQDYKSFEILFVNDRSDDDTQEIAKKVAAKNDEVKVIHIKELPEGWIGKNYALHVGAEKSKGEILLFTDADVVMEETAVRKAVARMLQKRRDHIAVVPQIVSTGVWLSAFLGGLTLMIGFFNRPWKARDTRSKKSVGIGAFNLIRKSAYEAMGTHEAIRLRPDEDIRFGQLVKAKGLKQECLIGAPLVSVEWYTSLRGALLGLQKSYFAALDYNLWKVGIATLVSFWFFLFPFVGIFLSSGLNPVVNLMNACILIALYAKHARLNCMQRRYALGLPFAAALHLYLLWYSSISAIRTSKIEWRGTPYSLKKLRSNRL